MNLPESFGLKTEKRSDGKLDIIGNDDAGRPYHVRTTDGPEITETDVRELKAADRESYDSREEGARAFCTDLVESGRRRRAAQEAAFLDDLSEVAGPVAFAGLERRGHSAPFTGSTRAYRVGWDRAFGEEN